jgi:hypothetical protein
MAFPRRPLRTPAPVSKRAAVFAVGRRVFTATGDRSAGVTLTDDADQPRESLGEGAEVTIVAWRPGWAGNTRYCVRVTDSGREGWLMAHELRTTKAAIASPPALTAPPTTGSTALRRADAESSGRKFGQRF